MTSPRGRVRRCLHASVLALAVVAGLTACEIEPVEPAAEESVEPAEPTATTPAVPPLPGQAVATARTRLDELDVRPRPKGTLGYARDAFGSSWRDIDGNGCNQRDDVLLRDAKPGTTKVQQQGRCDHDVLAGTWIDPYAGRTLVLTDLKNLSQAQAVQVDHIVPLAEAWVSGANAWSDDRREQYANTLSGLLAVDGPTNASKGAGDPAAWRPRKAYQCRYAVRWITIKRTWKLAVDPSEAKALNQMLGYC